MVSSQMFSYIFVVFILTITPGADTMLVLRNVFSSGKRSGIITTMGICSGLFIYALITALGISVIFTTSELLYGLLKTVGATYLIYLGVGSLLPIIKNRSKQSDLKIKTNKTLKSDKKAFTEGFLSNLFNPKIAVFYLTFLPQFINPGGNVLIQSFFLTGIHIVMGIVWLSCISVFVGSIQFIYTSIKLRHGLEAISGTVMILFGLLLLWEK